MIAILKNGTTIAQREHLIDWLKRMGLEVHLSQGQEITAEILDLIGGSLN